MSFAAIALNDAETGLPSMTGPWDKATASMLMDGADRTAAAQNAANVDTARDGQDMAINRPHYTYTHELSGKAPEITDYSVSIDGEVSLRVNGQDVTPDELIEAYSGTFDMASRIETARLEFAPDAPEFDPEGHHMEFDWHQSSAPQPMFA